MRPFLSMGKVLDVEVSLPGRSKARLGPLDNRYPTAWRCPLLDIEHRFRVKMMLFRANSKKKSGGD